MMLTTAVISLLLAATTQTEALFTDGMPPSDVPTFEVAIGDDPPFFAAVRIGGAWVTDHRTEIRDTQSIELVMDSPFYTAAPFSVPMRRATLKYEAPAMRRARLEELWRENGFTFVETAAGWRPVREADIALAKRAHAMAEAAHAKPAADVSVEPVDAPSTDAVGMQRQTVMLLRGVIVLLGVVVAAVTLKMIYGRTGG